MRDIGPKVTPEMAAARSRERRERIGRIDAAPLERCPTPNVKTGSSCKRRGCPFCGGPWARRVGTLTKLNLLLAYDGPVAMISITAPGAEPFSCKCGCEKTIPGMLPWSCALDHVHGGKRGCQVKEDPADMWAESCRDNWRRLRDAARKAVRKAGLPTSSLVLDRVWEPQKRGVPHLHVVCGMKTELERIAAARFVHELHVRSPDYFFGFVDRKLRPIGAQEAARYLVSYLTGRSRTKGSIRENIAHPRMPRSIWWVSPQLTRVTLITMRRLRYASWYFAALNGRVPIYPRLFGQAAVDVALVCARIEPKKARAPGEDEDARFRVHFANLRTMRALQPAWDQFSFA